MATQSFHETKNITCGEGGALLVNNPSFAERAEIIREKGTNRARFFRGQVDKYSWVDVGSSYVMSDILAAFLYGQLEQWQNIQTKRRSIWERYDRELSEWAGTRDIRRPLIPPHCEQAYHMYYLLMPSIDLRTRFIEHLASHDIKAVFHYLPLHLSSFAEQKQLGAWSKERKAECPVTRDVSDRLVRLPFYTDLSIKEHDCVLSVVKSFRP
jgi:dTDP-4-amino-4,6-dideoxygalactose transaminase